eukprot:CAMPEP_0197034470 /NCGR_PEP_ID=MMETSP1384-20130603/12584_1 /TAXON_ID=29189 /ORGANISM="Ammonia sp." /LENGTH=302 /DNA_ID=CAMNT_0042464409 /DNA_START=47 /DNA_END=955 /DNA_ORIENTATION=+
MSQPHYISRETQKKTDTRTKVSRIINFLKQHRGPHSIHSIRSKVHIDLQAADNLAVKNALQMNKKVKAIGSTFEYKPCIPGINNKNDLRQHLQNHPEGVAAKQLEDAYVSAKIDLSTWVSTGRIVDFMNQDSKEHIYFWYFGRLRKHPLELEKENAKKSGKNAMYKDLSDNKNGTDEEKKITMDMPEEEDDGCVDKETFPLIGDSIVATWNDIKIPATKDELKRQLQEVNLISGAFTKKRTRKKNPMAMGTQRKKRKMSMSRMNLTNTHMLQNEKLKQSMMAQNEKQNGGKEKELPSMDEQK